MHPSNVPRFWLPDIRLHLNSNYPSRNRKNRAQPQRFAPRSSITLMKQALTPHFTKLISYPCLPLHLFYLMADVQEKKSDYIIINSWNNHPVVTVINPIKNLLQYSHINTWGFLHNRFLININPKWNPKYAKQ